jgi:hypothetical protein
VKAKKPHWPLDRVKALAAAGSIFIQKGRASAFFSTYTEAFDAAQTTLAVLSEREYCYQSKQTDILDVYGISRGGGWMLKICIDEAIPEVAVVSFHPLERPIRTNKGMLKP